MDTDEDDGLPDEATATRGGRMRTPMRATPPPATGATDAMTMPGGSIADRRDVYEKRAAAANPSLTPLRSTPPPANYAATAPMNPDEEVSPGDRPEMTGQPPPAPAPGQPGPDGSIDLLAYGRANNIPRPAAGAPQSESNDPMTGGLQTNAPGSSVPATVPPATTSGHFGGTGPLRRSFSNPTSAAMYHSMVAPMASRLFSGKSGQSKARTGLRASPSAVA